MGVARIRPAVRRDLIEHFVYLAESASPETADRFLVNAEAAFEKLAIQPFLGAPIASSNPRLAGLRRWRVAEFENWLIFYMPVHGGISAVRVLHAAQDWWKILGYTH